MSHIYLSSLACELRRLLAGVLLSLPLAASATAPEQTFLPPQKIPLPGTMTFGKLVVADVNGDHFDDIVVIGSDVIDSSVEIVMDVYLNEGKTRAAGEQVSFVRQRLTLGVRENREAKEAGIHFGTGMDLQVVDIDGDGLPDLLASTASTGQIFILWNQGVNALAPFAYVPDTDLPTSPSMTLVSPLAQRVGGDGVLGTPIFVTAANLGDGTGRKSIIAYHGGLPLDESSKDHCAGEDRSGCAPFNRDNYESLAIISPTAHTTRGFNLFTQRLAWAGCDLAFGSTCPGWADGLAANTSLYNFRLVDQNQTLYLGFDAAPSDVMVMDGWTTVGTQPFYKPASFHPNASSGLQVLTGHGANGSDAVWLQGAQQVNEFVADNALHLMRRRTAIGATAGNERSAGSTFGTLSSGNSALITAGGMTVVYDPSNPGSAVSQPVPDYLNRAGQIGGWLGWASLNGAPALLSLSDYCRAPDPCADELRWNHTPLDGSSPPATHWGGSRSLVMLNMAHEASTPSGQQFEPFFQQPDDARFQAFSIMGGSVTHKPFVAAGHFSSPTESAIVMLDHADGTRADPTWNYLALYRTDAAKTYVSPMPHLDGLTVGRFIQDGLADVGNTLPKGEVSAVLVGAHLGTDTADGIRYVTVHDKTTGTMKGIFPVNPTETVKELAKDGVVVPGLSTLDIGNYTLEVHNAAAMASMNLNIVNPYGLTTTNYDLLAGRACGLLPNTHDGNLWPAQITVSVTGSFDAVDAVRWINADDGSVVNLGAEGARYDAAANTVTLIVPQNGKLKDGHWRAAVKANGVWQPVNRIWNVARDAATLATCATQVDFVNEEAYAQCTNKDYYLNATQYKVWPHLANSSFRFFGSGFAQNQIKSAAIKQGGRRYFSSALQLLSDNEIHVEFGDLSDKLAPDVETDVYFYGATSDVVESEGVPASGGRLHWRTARKGACIPKLPEIGKFLNTGSGTDGTWQSGDVIQVAAKNALYPVPSATKLLLKDDSGSIYMLGDPRLADDFYTHHYDNDNLVLYFTIPEDLNAARIKEGSSGGTTAYGAGLVAVESRALATTAISGDALAYMMAETSAPLVVVGGLTGGVLVYTGVVPTTWLNEKLQLLTKKLTDTPLDLLTGLSADNQRQLADKLYAVPFVSQPSEYSDVGPLDYVIVKGKSALEAQQKAKLVAIPAFMATNYFVTGPVQSMPYRPPIPALDAGASSLGMLPAGDAGTNPKGIRLPKYRLRYSRYIECGFLPPITTYVEADTNDFSPDSARMSIIWRLAVMAYNNPPLECGSHYVSDLGDRISVSPDVYVTDTKNDYTKL